MMYLIFALLGSCGSTWYWWLRTKELEAILRGTEKALNKHGLSIKDLDKMIDEY